MIYEHPNARVNVTHAPLGSIYILLTIIMHTRYILRESAGLGYSRVAALRESMGAHDIG